LIGTVFRLTQPTFWDDNCWGWQAKALILLCF